jgi:hypothetical protein
MFVSLSICFFLFETWPQRFKSLGWRIDHGRNCDNRFIPTIYWSSSLDSRNGSNCFWMAISVIITISGIRPLTEPPVPAQPFAFPCL